MAYLQGNSKTLVRWCFLFGICVCFSSLLFSTRPLVGKKNKWKSRLTRGHYLPLQRWPKSVKKILSVVTLCVVVPLQMFRTQKSVFPDLLHPVSTISMMLMSLSSWQNIKLEAWVLWVGWTWRLADPNSVFSSAVDLFCETRWNT